ncbi:hypothetical protein EV180_001833 [Coemansia sp. RSA 518]|nr:hypothetical protein EV180_001833 [Coemansia sp. RSA 518]KAJ2280573.1 hypothetical protein GGH14_002305 [Coemansia sp. RSA 370]
MREAAQDQGKGRCSAFEFLDIKALLQKTGCISGKPLPGQRVTPLPSAAHITSILRRPEEHSAVYTGAQRHVKFDLPSSESLVSDTTFSHDATNISDEGYIGTDARCVQNTQEDAYAMKYQVQHIPHTCLHELVELGALDRILVSYSRDVGRLSIDSFRPFRTLYFYGIVMYHLGKQRSASFDEAAKVCDAVVVLNNATAPTKAQDTKCNSSSLLSFLNLKVERDGNLTMPRADSDALSRSSWRDLHQARMNYAMAAGHLVAHLEEPAVIGCLHEHVAQRCIIRPVFAYMYRQFAETQQTELPVWNAALQFQIYSTVQEVMYRVYGGDMPASYLMYTTLFAIAETNNMIAHAVFAQDETAQLCSTILAADYDKLTVSEARDDIGFDDPLGVRELLCLLDWDFAAVLGYMLAHRYHEANQSITVKRGELGALSLGVDSSKDQPFPPMLPLQDTHFHQFVRSHVASVYARWPHGFFYMVLDEAVDAYNVIIHDIHNKIHNP